MSAFKPMKRRRFLALSGCFGMSFFNSMIPWNLKGQWAGLTKKRIAAGLPTGFEALDRVMGTVYCGRRTGC